MSLITRNNYEAFLLDYVEENLSPEQVAELMLFLEQNPDLNEDLSDFEIHTLSPEEAPVFDAAGLKKVDAAIDYEEFMIAEIEGVNSKEESALLKNQLAENEELRDVFDVYQKTKLVAPEIVFERKRSLKKKRALAVPLYWKFSSAAAAVIVLLWSYGIFENNEKVYVPIANNGDVIYSDGDNMDDLFADFIVVEESDLDNSLNDLSIVKKHPKQEKEPSTYQIEEEEKDWNQLAAVPQEEKKVVDSSFTNVEEEPNTLDNELLAENHVTITYEEEILDDGTPNLQKRKITKLDLVRAAVKHKLNGNLVKGKEKVLVALNTKPLSFLKKKKKK